MNFHTLILRTVSLAACAFVTASCSQSGQTNSQTDASTGENQPGEIRGARGGPDRSMGGAGGNRFAPVAANATAGEIFQQKCQNCHGAQGQGARGPSLLKLNKSDVEIRQTIHNGHDKMPAFGNQMTPAQMDTVVAYVRKLRAT
jgi:cytochrome c5